jgi:uncharacterized protein (TIGR03435 family)
MTTRNGVTRIAIARQPLSNLCSFLSRTLQRPIVDKTGLMGRYDAVLTFAAENLAPPSLEAAQDTAPPHGASLFGALQGQLGLKLEAKKLPVEFLVVESAEKTPVDN